jgi:nickel transport protein
MRAGFLRLGLSILTFVAATTTARIACAHDVWLTTAGPAAARRVIVNYGHAGDRPPAVADKVLDLVAVTREGTVSLLTGLAPSYAKATLVAQSRPFADSGRTLIAARYDNGYWVKIADNLYRNVSKRLAPDALDSLWSAKFAKAVTGPGAPWDMALGHELEIVPLADPAAARLGESLRVRVLFRGQPLAGAEVERGDGVTPMKEADIPRFKSDGDGIAEIPIVKWGPVVLAVDHRTTPSGTPDIAAADLFNCTFAFATMATSRGAP